MMYVAQPLDHSHGVQKDVRSAAVAARADPAGHVTYKTYIIV